MMLPNRIIQYFPIQVQPIFVMQELSIDSPQQFVCTFHGDVWQVRVFFWGGGGSPSTQTISTGAPLGYLLIHYLALLPIPSLVRSRWILGYPSNVPSLRGGGSSLSSCLPPPSTSASVGPSSVPPTPGPSGVLGLFSEGFRGVATTPPPPLGASQLY